MVIHATPFAGAGKTYLLADGALFKAEDYWDRIFGQSWIETSGVPAVQMYALRVVKEQLPRDDAAIYGQIARLGHIVHASELHTEAK